MSFSAWLKKIVSLIPLMALALAFPAFAQDSPGQGFFTTSDNVRLHYLEAGQGETLLFIPGWLMPADIWEAQLRDLSRQYHVVALDPRSQGGSDITPTGNDPLRRSKDVQELLDYLHIDSVVLVGWSLGAFDALAYLRQFGTDRINALVLVDSPLAAPSGPNPTPTRSPFLQRFQNDRENTGQDYVWSLFKKPPPYAFFKKLAQAEARVPTDIALADLDNTRPGDAWEPGIYALRKVPLLYVITPTYASQAAWLQQVDPRARVETFEDCGHALFVDQAARFNALIRDFLAQTALYPPGLPHAPRERPLVPRPTATGMVSSPKPLPTSKPVEPRATAPPAAAPAPTSTFTPPPFYTETPTPTPVPQMGTPTPSPVPPMAPHLMPPSAPPTVPRKAPPRPKAENHPPIQDGFFTTSDHVRLHYLEAGRGLTLVFIPGWLLPAEIWKFQLENLSRDYHVVALDPRSQGYSDITPQGDEPLRQARDIQELLDHLQTGSVVLAGWSHGAFQVLAYMNQFGTDRLYAAVLLDSSLGAASAIPASTPREARFMREFKADRPQAVRNFIWGLFKNPPPTDFFKALTAAAVRTPTDIALALLNNVFPGDPWQPGVPTLRQVPILYAVTPKFTSQADYLTQVCPQARVEIFQDTGHALFVDDADRFNDLLRDFLRKAALYPAGWSDPPRKRPVPGTPSPVAARP